MHINKLILKIKKKYQIKNKILNYYTYFNNSCKK